MPARSQRVYCQRCRAQNALGHELCVRCGTRLMLITEPSAQRFEGESLSSTGSNEHLLERISALENRLTKFATHLERTLDLLFKQARTAYLDQTLLDTLVDLLSETRTVDVKKLEQRWRGRCQQDTEASADNDRFGELYTLIVNNFEGDDKEIFEKLVREAFHLLSARQTTRSMRVLERAASLAPGNAPLNTFLGGHFFDKGRLASARRYLERAHAAAPCDSRVCLLLGLVCADQNETDRSADLLNEAVRRGGDSYAAHYALGRLLAAKSDWKGALREFKRALDARPSPEAHYVVGFALYQLERYPLALRHLSKAVEMDAEYAEALYLLGIVLLRRGERGRAAAAFNAAIANGAGESRYLDVKRAMRRVNGPPPPDFFDATGQRRKRLATGGDSRLAAALRDDALGMSAAR